MKSENEILLSELHTRGYACRVVSIQRLRDLEEDIKSRREKGMFDAEFYQERLTHFDFNPPTDMPDVRSIIVLAAPSPQTGVVFNWNGGSKTLILPPTYVGYAALPPQIEACVNGILNPMGYRAMKTFKLPIKPLAVHSGLAEYGRNNITYVEGLGSFHHLFAFYSDLPGEQDEWHELKMLKRCENCRACIIKCPSGAIGEDRFLLHAERCLVYFNEKPANVPFPAWVDPLWHNGIFGCMMCQRYCPEDKKFKDWVETRAEFTHAETALLLNGSTRDDLSPSTIEKLDLLELTESLDILPRNLGVLLNREDG